MYFDFISIAQSPQNLDSICMIFSARCDMCMQAAKTNFLRVCRPNKTHIDIVIAKRSCCSSYTMKLDHNGCISIYRLILQTLLCLLRPKYPYQLPEPMIHTLFLLLAANDPASVDIFFTDPIIRPVLPNATDHLVEASLFANDNKRAECLHDSILDVVVERKVHFSHSISSYSLLIQF